MQHHGPNEGWPVQQGELDAGCRARRRGGAREEEEREGRLSLLPNDGAEGPRQAHTNLSRLSLPVAPRTDLRVFSAARPEEAAAAAKMTPRSSIEAVPRRPEAPKTKQRLCMQTGTLTDPGRWRGHPPIPAWSFFETIRGPRRLYPDVLAQLVFQSGHRPAPPPWPTCHTHPPPSRRWRCAPAPSRCAATSPARPG